MYCWHCGRLISNDAAFCPYCGVSQSERKLIVNEPNKQATTIVELASSVASHLKSLCIKLVSNFKKICSRKRFKKASLMLIALMAIAITAYSSYEGYLYYNNRYLPSKESKAALVRLNKACDDIIHKLKLGTDSSKAEYAYKILCKETSWDYDSVPDKSITTKLKFYRNDAFDLIESLAYAGKAKWQFRLGQMYNFPDDYFIEPDTTKAVYWWNEAVKQGYTPAYNNLAVAYEYGEGGLTVDMEKAVELFKIGAEKGEDYAQWNYGKLFRDGVKVYVGQRMVLRQTANFYSGSNDNVVREYYDSNIGHSVTIYKDYEDVYKTLIPKDIKKAKYWWRKAAAQGNKGAKDDLQKVYE